MRRVQILNVNCGAISTKNLADHGSCDGRKFSVSTSILILAAVLMAAAPFARACDGAPSFVYSVPGPGKWKLVERNPACHPPQEGWSCGGQISPAGLTVKQYTIDGVTTKLAAPYKVTPLLFTDIGITSEMMYAAKTVTIQGTGNLPPGLVDGAHAKLTKMPADAEHLVDLKQPAPRVELVTKP